MRTKLMTGLALAAGLVLSGCATSEDASQTEAVVVGSQAYYSNEIIAENGALVSLLNRLYI